MVALLLPLSALANPYCVVPRLFRGVPVDVDVEKISKGICGMALIDNRYIPLETIAAKKVSGPVSCRANGDCSRRTDYFLTDADKDEVPYIIVFHGQKD